MFFFFFNNPSRFLENTHTTAAVQRWSKATLKKTVISVHALFLLWVTRVQRSPRLTGWSGVEWMSSCCFLYLAWCCISLATLKPQSPSRLEARRKDTHRNGRRTYRVLGGSAVRLQIISKTHWKIYEARPFYAFHEYCVLASIQFLTHCWPFFRPVIGSCFPRENIERNVWSDGCEVNDWIWFKRSDL